MMPKRAWIVLVAAALLPACRLGTLPAGPLGCVAQDAEDHSVRCAALADAYPGDGCTCVDAITRAAYRGRVQQTQ
ncbi:MAG: hypothetical protein KIT14_15225 [bacterium]|nr:hypothetical protein [bacterium]